MVGKSPAPPGTSQGTHKREGLHSVSSHAIFLCFYMLDYACVLVVCYAGIAYLLKGLVP